MVPLWPRTSSGKKARPSPKPAAKSRAPWTCCGSSVLSGGRPPARCSPADCPVPASPPAANTRLGQHGGARARRTHTLSATHLARYGLTAGICTDSLARSTDFAARAQAGVVKINRPTAGLDLNVPFGGVKDSSTNTFREQGRSAVDFSTWGKTVYTGV
ncbi:aldehyde dehydrogenase family protein [Rhodococcus opacus]|uniref:aldehyde dehydrogenase family protein n=1 Tax=Rhodococcus opacus TaxID=37919 RepID=UPI000A58FED6|nr:aldehyde dehydrogenase family protein [Rhodococcus opacus]